MASQITGATIVFSTVCSDADQRKHQGSASLVFVWGIHRQPVNTSHKGLVTCKCFHLMASSCEIRLLYESPSSIISCVYYVHVRTFALTKVGSMTPVSQALYKGAPHKMA